MDQSTVQFDLNAFNLEGFVMQGGGGECHVPFLMKVV